MIVPFNQGRRFGAAGRCRAINQGDSTYGRFATRFPGAVAIWDPSLGVTLGSTPRATGTTPPVVTISGTLAQNIGLYIQIDGAGTLGIATFKWSTDNGSTFAQTGQITSASFVLGATGVTASFAAGTYATDNVYNVTVSAIADQKHNFNVVQGTAAFQPGYLINADATGKPAINYPVGPTNLTLATSGLTMTLGQWTIIQVARVTNITGAFLWTFLDGGAFTSIVSNSSSPLITTNVAGVVSSKNIAAGTLLDTTPHTVFSQYGGTHATNQIFVDGGTATATTDVSAADPGAAPTARQFFLCSSAGIAFPLRSNIFYAAIVDHPLSPVERAYWRNYLKGRFSFLP